MKIELVGKEGEGDNIMDGRNLKVKSNKLVSVTRVRVNNRLRKES
jgi:hypothetical protein